MFNRRNILIAAGYAGFALICFFISMFLTFDYEALGPIIKKSLERATNAQVQIGSVSSYRLSGVSLKNIRLRFKEKSSESDSAGDNASSASSFTLDSMRIRMKLLPLIIGRKSLTFAVLAAGGKITGSYSARENSLKAKAHLENLMLDRIPMAAMSDKGLRLGGKMQGEFELHIKDKNDTSSWFGNLELDLAQAKTYPFSYLGVDVPEIPFSAGEIEINLDQGMAEIAAFKFDSRDLPIDLKGTVDLRTPLEQSFVDIKGSIRPGSELQKKVPLITSAFSPSQPFSYKGNIEALMRTF